MELLIFTLIIVYFVIDYFVAEKFEKIANEKGHKGYLGWCFWLGIAGWAMVIALPDRGMNTTAEGLAPIENDELPDL